MDDIVRAARSRGDRLPDGRQWPDQDFGAPSAVEELRREGAEEYDLGDAEGIAQPAAGGPGRLPV